jgi:competence protein ComEC
MPAQDPAALGWHWRAHGGDGRLTITKTGNDNFAIREWLAADADWRLPNEPGLGDGFSCDRAGCVAALKDGSLVSLVLRPEAFEEDCARARLVISPRTAPPFCGARVIDRTMRSSGALALTWNGTGFGTIAARPATQDRPWAHAPRGRPPTAGPGTTPAAPVPTRDATPRMEDLGPDD